MEIGRVERMAERPVGERAVAILDDGGEPEPDVCAEAARRQAVESLASASNGESPRAHLGV